MSGFFFFFWVHLTDFRFVEEINQQWHALSVWHREKRGSVAFLHQCMGVCLPHCVCVCVYKTQWQSSLSSSLIANWAVKCIQLMTAAQCVLICLYGWERKTELYYLGRMLSYNQASRERKKGCLVALCVYLYARRNKTTIWRQNNFFSVRDHISRVLFFNVPQGSNNMLCQSLCEAIDLLV